MNFKLCAPAAIYLALSVIGIIWAFYEKFPMGSLLLKTLFILIWTWLLSFLCSQGYENVSWALLLLPIIFSIAIIILIFEAIKKDKSGKHHR